MSERIKRSIGFLLNLPITLEGPEPQLSQFIDELNGHKAWHRKEIKAAGEFMVANKILWIEAGVPTREIVGALIYELAIQKSAASRKVPDPNISQIGIWISTCGDGRVCECCAKHGGHYALDEIPALPPYHYGCRCMVAPLLPVNSHKEKIRISQEQRLKKKAS